MRNFDCQECGRLIEGDGEVFHPYWYCVLQKAGQLDVALKDIESQKLAHGEMVIGKDEPLGSDDTFEPGRILNVPIKSRNRLRAEQRERNK